MRPHLQWESCLGTGANCRPRRGVQRAVSSFAAASAACPLALVAEGQSGAQQSGPRAIRPQPKGNRGPAAPAHTEDGFPEKPWSSDVLAFVIISSVLTSAQ